MHVIARFGGNLQPVAEFNGAGASRANGAAFVRYRGNGRLPFSFGGADCPFGLARGDGRLAAVGQACSPLLDRRDCSGLDFAVAVYRQTVTPVPHTPSPTSPMPSPTLVPADEGLYLPLIRR